MQVVALEPALRVLPIVSIAEASFWFEMHSEGRSNKPRTGAASQKRGYARSQGLGRLLRTDVMDVGVNATGGDNLALGGDDVGTAADNHVGGDAVHDVRAPGLANADNEAVLDANVGLVDAGPVDNQGVGNDDVERLGVAAARGLAHALAQRLAAAKLALVAVRGHVALDLDPEVGVAEADEVAGGGAEHGGVGGAVHLEHVDVDGVAARVGLGDMREPGRLQTGHDVSRAPALDDARGEAVAAAHNAPAAHLDERHRLGVARLEAHRGACRNVQPVAVRAPAVKLQLRVDLDEVVVRADLDGAVALARDAQPDPRAVLVQHHAAAHRHHGPGLLVQRVLRVRRQRERLRVRHGEEAAVQRTPQVAVVGGDGVVDGDEICAHGERPLHLDLAERAAHRREDVPPSEHRRAEGHEIRDRVVAIADEFMEVVRDQGLGTPVLVDELLVWAKCAGTKGCQTGFSFWIFFFFSPFIVP